MATVRMIIALVIVTILGWMGWSVGLFKIPFIAELTEQQQIAEDEVWCGLYDALINMKAADNKSKDIEDKILKTLLNHKFVYKKSLCNMVRDMDALIPPGTARQDVPRRQAVWYVPEFILEGERKRALASRIRELEKLGYGHRLMPDWEATHFIRPNRKRTVGNQTAAEIEGLKKELAPVPRPKVKRADGAEAEDLEGGFTFFKPKR